MTDLNKEHNMATTNAHFDTLRKKFEETEAAAKSARVPDEDRTDKFDERVTTAGWYKRETKSGRPAWTRFAWGADSNPVLLERETTYDIDAEKAYGEADIDAEPWKRQ